MTQEILGGFFVAWINFKKIYSKSEITPPFLFIAPERCLKRTLPQAHFSLIL